MSEIFTGEELEIILDEKQRLMTKNDLLEKEIERLNNDFTTLKLLQQKHLEEIERLNNIINRTTKYVQSLSSKGRGCDIYADIKQNILKDLRGGD